jgi:hypothetical protein
VSTSRGLIEILYERDWGTEENRKSYVKMPGKPAQILINSPVWVDNVPSLPSHTAGTYNHFILNLGSPNFFSLRATPTPPLSSKGQAHHTNIL